LLNYCAKKPLTTNQSLQKETKKIIWLSSRDSLQEAVFEWSLYFSSWEIEVLKIDESSFKQLEDADLLIVEDFVSSCLEKFAHKIIPCCSSLSQVSLVEDFSVVFTQDFSIKNYLENKGKVALFFPLGVNLQSFSLPLFFKKSKRIAYFGSDPSELFESNYDDDFFLKTKKQRRNLLLNNYGVWIDKDSALAWKFSLEAASCGIILFVSSKLSFSTEIIHGKNGWIVSSFEEINLIITKGFSKRDSSMRFLMKKKVEAFSWESLSSSLEVYLEMAYGFLSETSSKNRESRFSDFLEKKTLYLANADPMNVLMSSQKNHSKGVDSMVMVAGGLSGLNLLVNGNFKNIVVFDRNLWALTYVKLMFFLITKAKDRWQWLEWVFARRIAQDLRVEDFSLVQKNYLEQQVDENIIQKVFNFLPSDLKIVYEQTLVAYYKDPSIFWHCQKLLPCWPKGELVPVRTGHLMTKDGILNTNTFFFGEGWLESNASFSHIQEQLINSKVTFCALDLIRQKEQTVQLLQVQLNLLFFLSNIFDFFPDKFPNLLKSWRGICKENQKKITITTQRKIFSFSESPHDFAQGAISSFLLGNLIEIVPKRNFGFQEWNRKEFLLFEFLENNPVADCYLFHNLIGHGLDKELFIKALSSIKQRPFRLIILEHNAFSKDFSKNNYFSREQLIECVPLGGEVISDSFLSGIKDEKRNLLFVVDYYSSS
jgi:hypothetical protein